MTKRSVTFLDVSFGDNDFGGCMVSALSRLWDYVNENNGHLTVVAGRSVPAMFCQLHAHGKLEPMIHRLWALEYLCSHVESATRGLYWEQVDWENKNITDDGVADDYLQCSVKLRFADTFRSKWQNGEHAWLDLRNGDSETF